MTDPVPVGTTLRATPADVQPDPDQRTYSWLREGGEVGTGQDYTTTAADGGTTDLRVREDIAKAGYIATSTISDAIEVEEATGPAIAGSVYTDGSYLILTEGVAPEWVRDEQGYWPEFDPVTFPVTRRGFAPGSNVPSDFVDEVQLTHRMRQTFPNQALVTDNFVAMAGPIYTTDTTPAGIANDSTLSRDEFPPCGMWTMPERELVLDGETYRIGFSGAHIEGRDGTPFARVDFRICRLSDDAVVTTFGNVPLVSKRYQTGLYLPEYEYNMDAAEVQALPEDDYYVDVVLYFHRTAGDDPWVSSVDGVGFDIYSGIQPRRFQRKATAKWVYVNADTGGTGEVYDSRSEAENGAAWSSVAAASSAVYAANGNVVSGCAIVIEPGTTATPVFDLNFWQNKIVPGAGLRIGSRTTDFKTTSGDVGQMATVDLIAAVDPTSSAEFYSVWNLHMRRTLVNAISLSSKAKDRRLYEQGLNFINCWVDVNGFFPSSTDGEALYASSSGRIHLFNTIDDAAGAENTYSNSTNYNAFWVVGCSGLSCNYSMNNAIAASVVMFGVKTKKEEATAVASWSNPKNQFIVNNLMYGYKGSNAFNVDAVEQLGLNNEGLTFIGNAGLQGGGSSDGVAEISTVFDIERRGTVIAHNTMLGTYFACVHDNATPGSAKYIFTCGNVTDQIRHAPDTAAKGSESLPDGSRVFWRWASNQHVGNLSLCEDGWVEAGAGSQTEPGEHLGLYGSIPYVDGSTRPYFADDRSSGTGGNNNQTAWAPGDVRFVDGETNFVTLPSRWVMWPIDLAGNAMPLDGSCMGGAYQETAPAVTEHTGFVLGFAPGDVGDGTYGFEYNAAVGQVIPSGTSSDLVAVLSGDAGSPDRLSYFWASGVPVENPRLPGVKVLALGFRLQGHGDFTLTLSGDETIYENDSALTGIRDILSAAAAVGDRLFLELRSYSTDGTNFVDWTGGTPVQHG